MEKRRRIMTEEEVLAAVQKHGVSLQYAPENIKNNEKVVLAAVQQNGNSLQYASEDMKNNEKVVLAAVQQSGYSLQYAAEELQSMICACMSDFNCTASEAAGAIAEPRIVQVSTSTADRCGYGVGEMVVHFTNLAGDTIATISLEPKADSKELRRQLASTLDVPAASLQIMLQSGERLRDVESTKPLQELLRLV